MYINFVVLHIYISYVKFLGGRVREGVNEQGIKFYKNLIDEIIEKGGFTILI